MFHPNPGADTVAPTPLGEERTPRSQGLSLDGTLWLAVRLYSLSFPICTMEVG